KRRHPHLASPKNLVSNLHVSHPDASCDPCCMPFLKHTRLAQLGSDGPWESRPPAIRQLSWTIRVHGHLGELAVKANALLVSASALASCQQLHDALRSAEMSQAIYRDLGHAEGLGDAERFVGVVKEALQ
ncbi:unnamed protein product, partial [Durusdinium trenchii]